MQHRLKIELVRAKTRDKILNSNQRQKLYLDISKLRQLIIHTCINIHRKDCPHMHSSIENAIEA